jgi:hypothetical protein
MVVPQMIELRKKRIMRTKVASLSVNGRSYFASFACFALTYGMKQAMS